MIPNAVIGCLWYPASPTSAQPGPNGVRNQPGRFPVPVKRVSRVAAPIRSANSGTSSKVRM